MLVPLRGTTLPDGNNHRSHSESIAFQRQQKGNQTGNYIVPVLRLGEEKVMHKSTIAVKRHRHQPGEIAQNNHSEQGYRQSAHGDLYHTTADTSEEVSSEPQVAMGTFQPSEKSQVAVTSPALLQAESL
ncbi:hypothetical protein Anapl_07565 [Anas platyrhynchos]|uniref:Uncharacterized protein n=1 Tax=Anas platyrhynchos TaxID=8839 RepID=R0LZP5_ANAPL|nr:hypothetical protein Anapl_07565 [Anas platyrhynchos]